MHALVHVHVCSCACVHSCACVCVQSSVFKCVHMEVCVCVCGVHKHVACMHTQMNFAFDDLLVTCAQVV